MIKRESYYSLFAGMLNPRNKDEIGWRLYDNYPTRTDAIHAARKGFAGIIWMVVKCEIIASSQVTKND